MNKNSLLGHVFYPCSQMKDYENFPPLLIKKASGSYLELEGGEKIIDAISSWWCKSLGHAHPRLQEALKKQMEHYEHVISANIAQESLLKLSEKLCQLSPHLRKIFYASEGSSAVEIALKMSLHVRKNIGQTKRKKVIALKNAYHGETLLALSVSDLGIYRESYREFLFPAEFIQNIPYVSSIKDPLWKDCSSLWSPVESYLNQHADELSAIILEPILQGSAGMRIYSQDFLRRLRVWTRAHGIHLVADEIMTGFGRTGYALASEHAKIEADFICLGKALTAGFLPMSAVLLTEEIYQSFYDDYQKQTSFLHSHTFSGNALAAAVALEALKIYEEENIFEKVRREEKFLFQNMEEVSKKIGRLSQVRGIGFAVAADLIVDPKESQQRLGYELFQRAIKQGVLLRCLGNTVYWFPPLNTSHEILLALKEKTLQAFASL